MSARGAPDITRRPTDIEHFWRVELEPRPALIVSQPANGRYGERLAAEEGWTTLIEKPFLVEADPGALTRHRR